MMADPYKKDDDESYRETYPFQNLETTSVLQETREFNLSSIRPRHCVLIITKLLYLLGQGKRFSRVEATDVFFNSTKLFISEDPKLKRMLYLIIKELAYDAENSFAAANSLLKAMGSNSGDEYKAHAIRTLRRITDASMFGAMDRHLKQAVVDQSASVASSALVSGLHLSDSSLELVRRWSSEIQTALKNRYHMVQYHALALMYKLRYQDALAVSKLVSSNITNFRSPLAHTLLIKYALRVLKLEPSLVSERSLAILQYFDSCLTYKNEMIVLEAAKALCSLELSPEELTPAVNALQSFLASMKPVQRFSAIKILNELANRFPILVSLCHNDIEGLVVDSNSHIATLAITTLLKIGRESNIDRLIKQISQFISDVPDDFRVVVVDSIRALCLKYPSKHHALLIFLSNALRDEGGYDYKCAIVDTIIELSQKIPESKETGIGFLCEFIEDCEFNFLLQKVLHFLGSEGPKSNNPARCIRFVYNRVMLECAQVRASAVITLAKFAAQVSSLRPSIIDILKRILSDQDDEVRDRAVFYVKILETGDDDLINNMIMEDLPVDILSLEHSLISYLRDEEPQAEFDLSCVVEIEQHDQVAQQQQKKQLGGVTPSTPAAETAESAPISAVNSYEEIFSKVPQLANLGKSFKSCQPEYITEEDSDYVVAVIKHIYAEHIVFQFNVTNKVESQQLEAVHVEMTESDSTDLQEEFFVEANAIKYDHSEACFVCMRRTRPDSFNHSEFSNVLKFKVREVDTETGEADEVDLDELEEDEYDLQECSVKITDFLRKVHVSFKEEWDKLDGEEYGDTAQFSTSKSLQECVDEVIQRVSMSPMNDSKVAKKNNHSLYFSGKFTNEKTVLLAVQLAVTNDEVVMIKVASRSEDEQIRQMVADILLQ